MEVKNGSYITLADLLLVVGGAQEGQSDTICAQRRLDYIRNIFFLSLIIKVGSWPDTF